MSNQSLEANILNTVVIRIGQYFQDVIKPEKEGGKYRQLVSSLITSNDKYSVYEALKNQKENTAFQLPYVGLSLETLTLDRNGSAKNIGAAFRMGEKAQNNTDNLFTIIRTVPVEFSCNLMFITDDFWQSLSFSAKLLLAVVDKSVLNFITVYNGVAFSIRVEVSEDITFPPKDNTLELSNIYEFNCPFKIHAHISGSRDFDKLETTLATKKIVVTPMLVPYQYEGLQFITNDSLPTDFFIDDGAGGYEKVVIE